MKRLKRLVSILLAAMMLFATSVTAYGQESIEPNEDKTLSPYFFVSGEGAADDCFPLKKTDVSVNINGVIADTYVTQTYTNEGSGPINAKYVFPAGTRVSVHGMKMTIGDKTVTATIKEKEEAKQEYEQAKSEGKSASLLEQQRPNVFTMDVANIMPGDVVDIELHYTELITAVEGTYQFAFPTVVGPRYHSPNDDTEDTSAAWQEIPYLQEGENPPGTYNINVNLVTGVPINTLTSNSHKIKTELKDSGSAVVTLADPEDFAGNRDFILDYTLTGEEVNSGLLLSKGEDENFFMLMVQPPKRIEPEDIPPREYIFVLDVSGSMYGFPLDTAKELIRNLVGSLRPTDTFNVILFSGGSQQMSPTSLPATKTNIQKALKLIDEQEGGGGTELAPALTQALAIPAKDSVSRSFVVITDGYIYGEKETFNLISENLGDASFFSFGIGSSVNRYLIDGIAKTGLGEAFVVTAPEEAEAVSERFAKYIQSPVLTDIQISYDQFQVSDVEPSHIPTLFAEKPIVLFGKWQGSPAGTISITGKRGTENFSQVINVSDYTPSEDNQGISYLWARTKVEQLSDYGIGNLDPDAVKEQVTQLGLTYNMMTPYTSFVAVIDEVRNKGRGGKDVKQPNSLPSGVSDLAVGGGYTSGSEPGSILLFCGTAIIIVGNMLIWRRRTLRQKR